jgi:hypothetical protein
LVHGAWHRVWCWDQVRRRVRAQGHDLFTPTLNGVADRSHLLAPEVDLETDIKHAGWKTMEIACSHDVMLDRPAALTETLLSAAAPGGLSAARAAVHVSLISQPETITRLLLDAARQAQATPHTGH